MKPFQISTRWSGRLRIVKVRIYDNIKQMRLDAERFGCNYVSDDPGCFSQALGVAHKWEGGSFTSNGGFVTDPVVGLIRLYRGEMGSRVITHEVTHLAVWIYHIDCTTRIGDPFENIENEEVMCYLVGDLVGKLVDRLYKYGLLL